MLGGPVGAGCPGDYSEGTIRQRRSVVDRERHRLTQSLRMQQDGLKHLRSTHATKRPDHVRVFRMGTARKAAVTLRL